MMELCRITLVNWHLFDAEDIDVQGNFGILGENRSGKSTILDMVQVVLTGANRHYLRLNAVAGEGAKGRSVPKRTVLTYCLGMLGDGNVRRNEALTYIALGFADREKQRPPVTIGLAIEARQTDTSETVLGRFVVTGKLLTAGDFTEKRADGVYAAHWDDVKTRIIDAVGAGHFINHRDKAMDFVREYMRRLVPSLPNAEQSAAALLKAIVNAMALNQGYSATEFVRRFILEDNPINIRDLRASIETYRSVSATIVTLGEKLEALTEIRELVVAFEESLAQKALEVWLARRAQWLASRAENWAFKQQIVEARRFIDAEQEDRDIANEGIREAEQEIERLRKAIAAHGAKTGREQWLEVLSGKMAESDRLKKEIEKRCRSATALDGLISGFDNGACIKVYCGLVDGLSGGVDRSALKVAEQELRARVPGIMEAVGKRYRETSAQIISLEKELGDIRRVLGNTRGSGGAAYLLDQTNELIRRLRSRGMDARPLCDLLEINDESWTVAAEGLLGRDREAVFVERHNILEATAIFREGRREFKGASLVSLNKLEEFRDAPQLGTFPTLFRSQDADAKAFLLRRYSNVRLALTSEEFNQRGRALMKDGLYDDGLVRSHRAAIDHKIGKAAQAAHLVILQQSFVQKTEALSDLQSEEKLLAGALAALDMQDVDLLADVLEERDECMRRMRDARDRIAAIDAAGDEGLNEKLRAQRVFQDRKKEELRTIEARVSKYLLDVAVAERSLKGGDSIEGSAMNLSVAKALYRAERRQYQYPAAGAAYRQRLSSLRHRSDEPMPAGQAARSEAAAHRKLGKRAEEAEARARDRNRRAEIEARSALHRYFNNAKFGVSSQVGPESELVGAVKPWMNLLIEDIESNELRRYEDKAREASERASVLFRGEFVNALNTRVSKMERDIEALNRSLRGHPFHNEIYSFHRTAEAQFLPILKIIEISRMSDDALDALFKPDLPDDYPHKDTIQAVEQLLEDPDKEVSAFEDYRNFYAFEIHMEDVSTKARTRWETRRNTGSGAEQQVPLYVAIGASLAAVYGNAGSHGGPKGMAPALFDEAFSKMDGKNQRAMMSFYADLGLQVVIAAPLEKKPVIIGYVHSLVEIDRIGEQSYANVVQIGKRARDEILAMNPEALSDAEIAARMAAE